VLPAVVSRDLGKQILVPDRLLRRWIPTNHEIHAQFTQERDSETEGNYSSLVKMVKWWQYSHSPRRKYLCGFTLECLIAAHAEFNDESLLKSFETLLRQIQTRYRTFRSLRRVPEPGATSSFKETGITNEGHTNFTKLVNETLSLIEQAQKATGLEQEIAIWQQIFGSEFPRQLS
jgi:hypothetical protein